MADTPERTVQGGLPYTAAARSQAGHGGDMVGFERMAHAQKKADKE